MIRRIILILLISLMLTACGGAAPTEAPAPIEEPAATEAPTEAPAESTESFAGELFTATSNPASRTPAPTQTPALTQTETPLPTLELPTEIVNAPALMVWDGVPTYLGDSTPGFSFRVTYDPDLWAITTDQFGFASLAHREIAGCVISVTSGRGLPPSISVEHEMLRTDTLTFDVGIAFENGVKKFVTYTGGDGNIITAFEVSFLEESEACIADAVIVLTTLRSVPASQATPTATP
jgi:hypothetical protein